MKFFQSIFLFVILLDTIFAQSTPITLGYKPIRPFYLPQNFAYPQPIIPPGTPWPASRTTLAPVTNTELPIKSSEDNQNELLVTTTISTVESSTTNIVEPSSRSPAEENVFNLLCFIIPCLSTSIHKETGTSLEQNVIHTTSQIDIDSTKTGTSVTLASKVNSNKTTEFTTPMPVSTKIDIDIRVKPTATFDPDMIVFPDQLAAAKAASNKIETTNILLHSKISEITLEENNNTTDEKPSEELNHKSKPVVAEDATSKPATTTVINLEYKPTRPPYAPDPVFYPQPAIKPDTSRPLAEEDVTSKPATTTVINLEYKPSRPPYAPDPVFYPQPAIKPDTSRPLAEEDVTSKPATTTVINLEYKPTRPPYAPDPVFYPQPAIKPDISRPLAEEDATSKPATTTLKPSSTTVVDLEYKPTRPPFVPDPVFYPQPAIKPNTSKPLAEEDATLKPATATVINLEYKPTRPPYAPDPVIYPQPAIKPDTAKPLAEEDATSKPDTTTVVNSEYKPTRPPFISGPVFYPQPAINTSASVNHTSVATYSTLTDKFAASISTSTVSPSHNNDRTTKRIIKYTTPISLEYKPTRPFYAPNPVFYPQPAIPPGTPWPAYSTTKSLLTNDNLV